MKRAYLVGLVLSLILHVTLGWMWSVVGAIVAGLMAPRLGALVGATSLVAAWGFLVIFSFVVAPGETSEMTRVVAEMLGNLPAPVTVGATLFMAALLGVTGGWLGSAVRSMNKK